MSENGGKRYNTDKPRLSLVLEFSYALVGWTRALMYGMDKYNRGNWRKGFKHTECADSAIRHLNAWQSGEDYDPESGLKHVDMFLCNAGFLAEMVHTRPDLDDRPQELKDHVAALKALPTSEQVLESLSEAAEADAEWTALEIREGMRDE